MINTLVKHQETFEVLFYHLDRKGRLSVRSLMNFMQATANMHGKVLGTSLDDLSEESYTWVFSRFHIHIVQYPVHYDKLVIRTWRSDSKKCFAFREFEVFDSAEKQVAAATVSAVLIDKKTRKPTDIPDRIKSQFAPGLGRALQDNFQPMKMLEELSDNKSFHVRLSDIDMNNHVNNTSYLDWIIESLPEDILLNYTLESCEIGYKAEAVFGDNIISYSAPEQNHDNAGSKKQFLHSLVRERDQRLITTAVTKWKRES